MVIRFFGEGSVLLALLLLFPQMHGCRTHYSGSFADSEGKKAGFAWAKIGPGTGSQCSEERGSERALLW